LDLNSGNVYEYVNVNVYGNVYGNVYVEPGTRH
jgi:hypothetical protein